MKHTGTGTRIKRENYIGTYLAIKLQVRLLSNDNAPKRRE